MPVQIERKADSASDKRHKEFYEEKRRMLIRAARASFERSGKLTVAGAADEAGITRELVYYYFDRGEGLVAAVMDSYVREAVARLRGVNAAYGKVDWKSADDARTFACAFVCMLRKYMYSQDGSVRSAFGLSARAWQTWDFMRRVAFALAVELTDGCGLDQVMRLRGFTGGESVRICESVLLATLVDMRFGKDADDARAADTFLALLGLPGSYMSTREHEPMRVGPVGARAS